jgi:hypothetical protein
MKKVFGILAAVLALSIAITGCKNGSGGGNPGDDEVAVPTASPAAGTYSDSQSVVLSCSTFGAAIYYTTDGSTPTKSSSKYSGAVSISTTTTIKAIALKDGMKDSGVLTAKYIISVVDAPLKDTIWYSDSGCTTEAYQFKNDGSMLVNGGSCPYTYTANATAISIFVSGSFMGGETYSISGKKLTILAGGSGYLTAGTYYCK